MSHCYSTSISIPRGTLRIICYTFCTSTCIIAMFITSAIYPLSRTMFIKITLPSVNLGSITITCGLCCCSTGIRATTISSNTTSSYFSITKSSLFIAASPILTFSSHLNAFIITAKIFNLPARIIIITSISIASSVICTSSYN